MTWELKYNENLILIELYLNYLNDVSTSEAKLNLVLEIYRLHHQNELIQKLPMDKFLSSCTGFKLK